MISEIYDLRSILISQYFSFQKLEIDFKYFAREMTPKINFKLLFYRKYLESISNILNMRYSLISLHINFRFIFYGKDL